jgi:predicted HicB family RNase H-like nuclease
MVTPMNEKLVRKPRNVKINPDAFHRAQVEALRERKTLDEWLEEAIDEKIQRAKRRLNTVPVKRILSL